MKLFLICFFLLLGCKNEIIPADSKNIVQLRIGEESCFDVEDSSACIIIQPENYGIDYKDPDVVYGVGFYNYCAYKDNSFPNRLELEIDFVKEIARVQSYQGYQSRIFYEIPISTIIADLNIYGAAINSDKNYALLFYRVHDNSAAGHLYSGYLPTSELDSFLIAARRVMEDIINQQEPTKYVQYRQPDLGLYPINRDAVDWNMRCID